jgi:hypothetical protein
MFRVLFQVHPIIVGLIILIRNQEAFKETIVANYVCTGIGTLRTLLVVSSQLLFFS